MDNKRNRRANRVVWVAVLMFAASIFCQGFNSELGFRIAGGIAILFSLIGLFWGLDWDDDTILKDTTFKDHPHFQLVI